MWRRPICLVNAQVVGQGATASSLRFSRRILSVNAAARPGDVVLDLDGAFVFPGLINGHDHLELNHYGRLKLRERYDNASEWIEDMRPMLTRHPAIRQGRAHPLASRLFIGGMKNLLAGATTVGHHNPFYRELRRWFPVRVVRRYGWAHSFFLQDRPSGARGERGGDVRQRYRATPANAPFFIHLAEGVDRAAGAELGRLHELGCLGRNSVLIHGVGISRSDWARVVERGAGLVWCPASNVFLLGRSAPVRQFADVSPESLGRVCLGTDSRLTGSRDLLDEMRAAVTMEPVTPAEVVRMVTSSAASLLGLSDAGRIAVGVPADLLVVPPLAGDPARALLAAARKDVALVTIGGQPMIASPSLEAVFAARRAAAKPLTIDGAVKLLDGVLVRRLQRCSLAEPGIDGLHECDPQRNRSGSV